MSDQDNIGNTTRSGSTGRGITGNSMDHLLEGCQIIGPDWRYIYLNDAAARHGQSTKEHLTGKNMLEIYPGIETTPMFAMLRNCMEQRVPGTMENEFTFPDGSAGWFELRFDPVPQGVFILSLDITEQKHAQQTLTKVHRALRMLSDCNQAIIRSTDETSMMQQIVDIIAAKGGYAPVWVSFSENTTSAGPRARASGNDDRPFDAVLRANGQAADTVFAWAKSPSETAALSGETTCFRSGAHQQETEIWQRQATARNIGAHLAFPLKDHDRVTGVLNICSREPTAFTGDELILLTELAGDLSYGLNTLRIRAAHREAEARIRHLNAALRGIRNVNQLITRERDPGALIGQACELLVESRGFDTCCIILNDGDTPRLWADAGSQEKLGPLKTMLEEGRFPACVREVLNDSRSPVQKSPVAGCSDCPVNLADNSRKEVSFCGLKAKTPHTEPCTSPCRRVWATIPKNSICCWKWRETLPLPCAPSTLRSVT